MDSFDLDIQIGDRVVFEKVGGEAVLLNLVSGKYYGLDEVGTRIWTLLSVSGRLEAVHQALLKEYDVPASKLRKDLLSFVEDLVAHGLLQVVET